MTAIKYINDCYRYSGGSSSSTLIKTAGAAWVGYQVGIIIVIMIIIKMAIYCPQGSGTLRQQYTLLYSVTLCFLLFPALHRFTLL